MAHLAPDTRPGLAVKMQSYAWPRERRLEAGWAVVSQPQVAEEIVDRARAERARLSQRQVAHRADELLELARRAGDLGLVKRVVRTRRQLVDEQAVVAEEKQLDGENALQ